MHALARRLPVIAREMPCLREIQERSPHAHNLHLFSSTAEMARATLNPPAWRDNSHAFASSMVAEHRWEDAAAALSNALQQALATFDYDFCVRQQGEMLRQVRSTEGSLVQPERTAVAASPDLVEWLSKVCLVLDRMAVRRPWWWGFMPRPWLQRKKLERLRRRNLFDAEAYVGRHPDVASSGQEPFWHYINHGLFEKRLR
jgi:hypothetical protein